MYKNIKSLYKLLTIRQRKKLIFLQTLVIFMSFVEVVGVMSIGPYMSLIGDIDQIYGENYLAKIYLYSGIEDPSTFLIVGAFVVIFILSIAAIINIFTIWKVSMYAAEIGAEFSNRLFVYYLGQSWIFHASGNSSELVNKIVQECNRLSTLVITPLMQLMARFVMGALMVVAIIIYNPVISTIASILFASAYFGLYKLVRKRLDLNGQTISIRQKERFKLMSEGFGGIKDTLLLGREANFSDRFINASNTMARALGTSQTLSFFPKYLLELLAFSGVVFLVLSLIFSSNGDLASILPTLAIFSLAGFKILPTFQLCYSALAIMRANMSSFIMLEEDLYNSSKVDHLSIWSSYNLNNFLEPKKNISINNIYFQYPNTENNTLNGVSLEIPVGNFIGLVGYSGSGKSTLVDILLGLIQPKSGLVMIDGEELNASNIRSWQNAIGVVSQNIFLADSSIQENIAFGLPVNEIDKNKINSAIELANLKEFVNSLPDGLDTRVGERGIQLSGGQRQRIGIARALYTNSSVLIFDEATSSLDGVTEKKVMDAIYNLTDSKTIIVIAHRLGSVKRCDCIYLLENGRISDSGNYEQLSNKNELFKKMTELS